MMSDDLNDFRDLAWKALEAPGDAALRDAVSDALTAHPEWTDEWRILRETHHLAAEAVPAALARNQADRSVSIPAERLTALSQRLHPKRNRPWIRMLATAAALVALGFFAVRPFYQTSDSAPVRLPVDSPASLVRAFATPVDALLATAKIPTLRSSAFLQVRSPIIAAQAGQVTVDWISGRDGSVTVRLTENGQTLWQTSAAIGPVQTPALPADHAYELLLTDSAGNTVREVFATVPADENTPHEAKQPLSDVLDPATATPARLGEAVLAWHALPSVIRQSDAGRQLGIWLALEARQPDILEECRTAD